jgi:hypothetical protein
MTPNEGFTRFLVHSNQFVASKGRVLPPALVPRLNRQKLRWETSAHRIDGLRAELIWALGYRYVEDLSKDRQIRARASGVASFVTERGLQWDVNGQPYPRHADIIGWSVDEKHARMMVATEIANRMLLEIDPRR